MAKTNPAPVPAADAYVPYDIVYMGRLRSISTGKLYVQLCRIAPDGSLLDDVRPLTYEWDKAWRSRIVGGVYNGASFNGTSVKGYGLMRFLRQWDDRGQVIEWQAKDAAAEAEAAAAKLEKDAKRMDEIDVIMYPLRKQYAAARARFDPATMHAIERAVVMSLKSGVRASEKE